MESEYVCRLCFKKFKTNGFGKHIIGRHHMTIKSYYDQFIKKDDKEGVCLTCNKPTEFYAISKGYTKFCSYKCSAIGTRYDREKTCLKNHNVLIPYQSKEIQERGRITSRKKFGTDYAIQNKQISQKRGDDYFKLHNVRSPMQLLEIRLKFRKTCKELYDCEYPIQNLEIFQKREKTCFKRKEFIFPSGNVMIVQGEEPQFLKHITDHNIIQEHEISKGIKFQYYTPEGKLKNYYSDFLIKNLNLIIEIKSSYILDKYEKYMREKENSVKQNGYNFILIVDQKFEEFDNLVQSMRGIK